MTNPGGGESLQTVSARFTDWAPFSDLHTGLKASHDADVDISGYTASEYDRPVGAVAEGIAIDGAGSVALTYSSFAYWTVVDFFGADGEQFIAAAGAATGSVSPSLSSIAGLPTSAVYTGVTTGSAIAPELGYGSLLAGTIKLTANFETSLLRAEVYDITLYDGDTFDAAADPSRITFTGVAIDAPSASFAGSTGSGMTVTTDGGPAILGGALAGHFYGPKAEEAAGTWSFTQDLVDMGTMTATGSFGAKR